MIRGFGKLLTSQAFFSHKDSFRAQFLSRLNPTDQPTLSRADRCQNSLRLFPYFFLGSVVGEESIDQCQLSIDDNWLHMSPYF